MDQAIAGLSSIVKLSPEEEAEIRALSRTLESHPAGAHIDRTSLADKKTGLIVSGWACEQRILMDGRRQIFSFLLPGDPFVVSRNASLGTRAIVALTKLEVVDTSSLFASADPVTQGPCRALAAAAALRSDRLFDHVVRLGRQSAYERTVHLLLELRDRLSVLGQVKADSFRIPLTQEIFADALGLSIVHVNRVLKQLRKEAMIELRRGGVSLLKPKTLSVIAGHEPAHSDQAPNQWDAA